MGIGPLQIPPTENSWMFSMPIQMISADIKTCIVHSVLNIIEAIESHSVAPLGQKINCMELEKAEHRSPSNDYCGLSIDNNRQQYGQMNTSAATRNPLFLGKKHDRSA